ncbi:MAG TPA: response regulator transcription factor, partial [Clostridia bacterium]
MISVMVVDDHEIIRKALKYVLESDPEIKVVCMASNGLEALGYCEKSLPDVILMDIMMPVLNGVEGTKRIKVKFPMVKIILITTFDEEKYIEEGLLNGADGYITKDIREEDLKSIIRSTYNG